MKVLAAVLACVAVALAAPAPQPTPPGIPSPSTARSLLTSLTVDEPGSSDGYSRKKFPHWKPVDGHCNAREFVLKRDGENVEVSDTCKVQSGTWVSPYDGVTVTSATKIDIDHFVPLENAWISGASEWTTAQRRAFANDITRPQLWAVSSHINRSKGDKSPDEWKPPLKYFWCTYADSWVAVKSYYNLTITDTEHGALAGMLDTC